MNKDIIINYFNISHYHDPGSDPHLIPALYQSLHMAVYKLIPLLPTLSPPHPPNSVITDSWTPMLHQICAFFRHM